MRSGQNNFYTWWMLMKDTQSSLCKRSLIKGTVSPDYKCLEVISTKSPLLGHVTLDTKIFKLSLYFLIGL